MLRDERIRPWVVITLLLGSAAAFSASGFFGHELMAEIAIFAIFAMSVDLLGGYAGLVSFGHAGFLGIGAYATAYFTAILGWPAAGALPISVAIGALAAAVVGAFVVRTSSVFFIMVTLAISMMFHAWAFKNPTFNGADGLGGVKRLDLSVVGIDLGHPSNFAVAMLVVCFIVWYLLERIVRSPFGHVLLGIRQNERRMRALGCPVFQYKLGAFVLSGALATFAGSLLAQHTSFVSPELADWIVSGDVLIVVIIGGMGTLLGPIIGSALFIALRHELSTITEYWLFYLGIVFILIVLFSPEGIYGRFIALLRRSTGRRKSPAEDTRQVEAEIR